MYALALNSTSQSRLSNSLTKPAGFYGMNHQKQQYSVQFVISLLFVIN